MKKLFFIILALASLSSKAQTVSEISRILNTTPQLITTTSVSANNTNILSVDLSSVGYRTVQITITGTWAATISFQGSPDNFTTVDNIPAYQTTAGSWSTTTTSNGTFLIPCYNYRYIRVRTTSYTSGTVDAVSHGQLSGAKVPDYNTGTIGISGTVTANQGGTWNINNISGTVSLPTGAATSANQTTGNGSLSSIDTKIPSNLTVTSTRLLVDGSGVTQPVSGTIGVSGNVTVVQPTATNLQTQSEAYQGGSAVGAGNPLQVSLANTGANATAVKVDGSSFTQPVSGTFWQATQPISGTVTANAGSGTFNIQSNASVNLSQYGGSGVGATNAIHTQPGTGAVFPSSQSGTWTVQPGNTANTTAWLVTGTGGTFPATQSGNWTSRIVGNTGSTVDGTIGAATAPTNMIVGGGVYNSTEITLTNGQSAAKQFDSKGRLRNVIMDAAGNSRGVNVNASNQMSVSVDAVPTLTLGTQGATGFSVQNLNDAGRTHIVLYATGVASGTSGTETAITLTKSSGTSATSSAASFAITNGKRFRIMSIMFAARGHSTATAQVTTFNFRINTGGAVTTSSTPIIMSVRCATPATSLAWDRAIIPITEGYEILGTATLQIGVTANAVFTTNAPTWDVYIVGYEY